MHFQNYDEVPVRSADEEVIRRRAGVVARRGERAED